VNQFQPYPAAHGMTSNRECSRCFSQHPVGHIGQGIHTGKIRDTYISKLRQHAGLELPDITVTQQAGKQIYNRFLGHYQAPDSGKLGEKTPPGGKARHYSRTEIIHNAGMLSAST
jgi:hypothetical protein